MSGKGAAAAVQLRSDQRPNGATESSSYIEEWPDTIFMHHPLGDLQQDWQTFVVNTVKTQDGKEMRKVLLACASQWERRLKEVEALVAMRPAQLRASFEQYVATARPAADERTPQTLDEYIDMISFQHWYLAQAVLITRSGSGKQQNRTAGQAAASAAVDSEMDERSHRSSYRSSNSACGFM